MTLRINAATGSQRLGLPREAPRSCHIDSEYALQRFQAMKTAVEQVAALSTDGDRSQMFLCAAQSHRWALLLQEELTRVQKDQEDAANECYDLMRTNKRLRSELWAVEPDSPLLAYPPGSSIRGPSIVSDATEISRALCERNHNISAGQPPAAKLEGRAQDASAAARGEEEEELLSSSNLQ